MRFIGRILAANLLCVAGAWAQAADAPHVLNVSTFYTGGNMQKFMEMAHRIAAVEHKLGAPGKVRIWWPYFWDANASQPDQPVTVTVEYRSLAEMTEYLARRDAAPEWRQLVGEMAGSGIKKIGNAVIVELPVPAGAPPDKAP